MTLPLQDDDRPPYVQVAAALRKEILSGVLRPGDKLPTARELQERFGVASSTVQNALRLLKKQNLIYSVQSRGSFVRTDPGTEREQVPAEGTDEPFDPAPAKLQTDAFNVLAAGISGLTQTLSELQKKIVAMEDEITQLRNELHERG
ncbi:GntR family transcriptional regulator [Streptomyces violascens]|uniref:GntR family transcriptional regulator n=1 Tax=Streptomyces violascens TaxID=67381 RepID=UPI00365CA7CD